ncbi:MAG: 50S ribosomal protein L11 methyltransferase [Pelotomaculum sp.]|nr:50S ribosomal protein L11 methyltransferase [Pelotomaculum sp.]
MEWLEITVRTPPEGVELVADIFQEIGTGGVVIEDPAVIFKYAGATCPEEWAVPESATADGLPRVKGYLPADGTQSKRLEELAAALARLLPGPASAVSTRTVSEEDWANAWKKYYKPVRAGRRLVVKPSWEDYRAEEGDLVIEMDPGMAFGSGTHATTCLCLRLLEKYVRPGGTVYDVGTGSGVLAVAAARLGAGRVVAVDIDPLACRVAAGNAERNGVAGKVQVVQGNLLEKVEGRADLVVANIIADVIAAFAPEAAGALAPGGVLIASGIIEEKAGLVVCALEAAGLAVCERDEEGRWVALAARLKA